MDDLWKLKKNLLDGSQAFSGVRLFHFDDFLLLGSQLKNIDKWTLGNISGEDWKCERRNLESPRTASMDYPIIFHRYLRIIHE